MYVAKYIDRRHQLEQHRLLFEDAAGCRDELQDLGLGEQPADVVAPLLLERATFAGAVFVVN